MDLDVASFTRHKEELKAFLAVFDRARANDEYIDSLFRNNDFETIRRLIKVVYKRVPAGWDGVPAAPSASAPARDSPLETWTAISSNPSFVHALRVTDVNATSPLKDGEDPTRFTIGLVGAILGGLMVFGALFATFAPFWALAGASAIPYGPRALSGFSLWFGSYTLEGASASSQLIGARYISDCSVDQGSVTVNGVTAACGALLASQIFSIFTLIACIACVVLSLLPAGSIKAFMNYVGIFVLIFGTLCFGLYFGSILRYAVISTKALCTSISATPSTCDIDEMSVSFWMMVALVPLGPLHAWISRWRYTVYREVSYDGNVTRMAPMNTFIRNAFIFTGIFAGFALLAGIVLGALDAKAIAGSTSASQSVDTCKEDVSLSMIVDASTKVSAAQSPGQLAPLCRDSSVLTFRPEFYPIGDVNNDNRPDFIAVTEYPLLSSTSTIFLVWGQEKNSDWQAVDFSETSSPFFVRLTIIDPDFRCFGAKALGDVTGDGVADFLLIYGDTINVPLSGFNHLDRRAFQIAGRSDWGTSSSLAVETLAALQVNTNALDFNDGESEFSSYFDRVSTGADLDNDGIDDWCTTSYSRTKDDFFGGFGDNPSQTAGFCIYGRSSSTVKTITYNNTLARMQDPSLGFGVVFPTEAAGVTNYYDLYTTRSMIGLSEFDDLIVSNHYDDATAFYRRGIFFTDGRSRASFGDQFFPLVFATKIITTTNSMSSFGSIKIVPLGTMTTNMNAIAVVYNQAFFAASSTGIALLSFTTQTSDTFVELSRFSRLAMASTDVYDQVLGGNVNSMFDYDSDGKPDLLLIGDTNDRYKVLFNHMIALLLTTQGTNSQMDSLAVTDYRNWVFDIAPASTEICGTGELCFNFVAVSLPLIMFSAGANNPGACSSNVVPSILYRSSGPTRIALGLFGFAAFVTVVLVGLFLANKTLEQKMHVLSKSRGENKVEAMPIAIDDAI